MRNINFFFSLGSILLYLSEISSKLFLSFLSLELDCVARDPRASSEEYRLHIAIEPIKINLDYVALEFFRTFFSNSQDSSVPSLSTAAALGSAAGTAAALGNPDEVTESKTTDAKVSHTKNAMYFQLCHIAPLIVNIDYCPQVDEVALTQGDYLQLLNILPLEGLELTLAEVKLHGVLGWATIVESMVSSWVEDITRTQLHRILSGIALPPIPLVTHVGSEAVNLILVSIDKLKKGQSVFRSLRKGTSSLVRCFTVQSLNTVSQLSKGTQAVLEYTNAAISPDTPQNSVRIESHGHGKRTDPSNINEGFYQAYDSIARGLNYAGNTIVAVPLAEYKRAGIAGYVKSVVRAVPIAILRPAIGATEAITKASLGIRNTIDPNSLKSSRIKYKM